MSDDDALIVEDDGPVRHLRLNRPEKLNALDWDQHERLITAVTAAGVESSVRVIVLSGAGRAFCAGDDLGSSAAWPDRMAGRRVDLDIGVGPALLLESCAVLRRVLKPTVVLLHGHALGSGYDYSLSCDFRLAAEDVNYGDPRMHLALWAAEGWSWKLPRQLNQAVITPIAYESRTMNGTRAHDLGLVHRVYPAGADLREAARPFLTDLAGIDADAYARTKQMILDGQDADFQQSQRMALGTD